MLLEASKALTPTHSDKDTKQQDIPESAGLHQAWLQKSPDKSETTEAISVPQP
jgi:hypothetical protein